MKISYILGIIFIAIVLSGCSPGSDIKTSGGASSGGKTYTIGVVAPLTGEGAVYGLPAQRTIEVGVKDLNAKWAAKNQKLEVIYEDGKCNGKDGLTAAQTLVNLRDVNVIYGGACSSETLGLAPFTEDNKILVFSALSSSPEVTKAGDYVFRNYPSDTAQVAVMTKFIQGKGHKKVALISENNDYAQALRNGYKSTFTKMGIEVVADEVTAQNAKDVRSELLKIKEAKPDALVILPQTIPMGEIYIKQIRESGIDVPVYSNEVATLDEALDAFGDLLEGVITPQGVFDDANPEYQRVIAEADCNLGLYCATIYDAVFILGDVVEECGDEDTECMRDKLYKTKNWQGLSGTVSFDKNGDVGGNFEVLQVRDGQLVPIT